MTKVATNSIIVGTFVRFLINNLAIYWRGLIIAWMMSIPLYPMGYWFKIMYTTNEIQSSWSYFNLHRKENVYNIHIDLTNKIVWETIIHCLIERWKTANEFCNCWEIQPFFYSATYKHGSLLGYNLMNHVKNYIHIPVDMC